MKFKHTFHVFVDNFSVAYKQLVYRLIITVIAAAIYSAILYPFISEILKSEQFQELWNGLKEFVKGILNGNMTDVSEANDAISHGFSTLKSLLASMKSNIALEICLLVLVRLIQSWFTALGNFATAALINDKMALHANSSFVLTLVKNLKTAALYALCYVPLSLFYDIAVCTGFFFFIFYGMFFIPVFLQIFLFVLIVVLAIVVKMTFTSDWLPSLIAGKKKQGEAFVYTFSRRRKKTFNVASNFIVLVLLIFAINVAAVLLTFGVGALLTIPSSYIILISFEFVNYYDREEMKYFIDKNTIIKPEREHTVTREEFFKGEN